ncbi:MAG: hypothetical protein R2788_10895 [Saprospiraceae bacterium]
MQSFYIRRIIHLIGKQVITKAIYIGAADGADVYALCGAGQGAKGWGVYQRRGEDVCSSVWTGLWF